MNKKVSSDNKKPTFIIHKKNKENKSNNNTNLSRELIGKNVFQKQKGSGVITKDSGEIITISFSDRSTLHYEYPSEKFFEECAFTRIHTVSLTGTISGTKPKKIQDDDNDLKRFQTFLKKQKVKDEVKEMSLNDNFYNTCIWGYRFKNGDYVPVQNWMDFFIQISKYLYKKNPKIFIDVLITNGPDKNNHTPYYSLRYPSYKWYGVNCFEIINSKHKIFIEQHITANEAIGVLRYCQEEYEIDDDDIKFYIGPRFKKRQNEVPQKLE